MTLLLTIALFGSALVLLGITLIFTGETRVHTSCDSTKGLEEKGILDECELCPNNDQEDQLTTLAKAGFPGRDGIISEEAFSGKKRFPAIERLKYWQGRS